MQEATGLGMSIPGDLSVIGFDNLLAASLSSPGLSIFDQDAMQIAQSDYAMIHGYESAPTAIISNNSSMASSRST